MCILSAGGWLRARCLSPLHPRSRQWRDTPAVIRVARHRIMAAELQSPAVAEAGSCSPDEIRLAAREIATNYQPDGVQPLAVNEAIGSQSGETREQAAAMKVE